MLRNSDATTTRCHQRASFVFNSWFIYTVHPPMLQQGNIQAVCWLLVAERLNRSVVKQHSSCVCGGVLLLMTKRKMNIMAQQKNEQEFNEKLVDAFEKYICLYNYVSRIFLKRCHRKSLGGTSQRSKLHSKHL